MPEIMKTHIWQASLFHQRCEEMMEAGGVQKPAVDIAEDQIMFLPC
jgi:hypothetical protein